MFPVIWAIKQVFCVSIKITLTMYKRINKDKVKHNISLFQYISSVKYHMIEYHIVSLA